jgi:hypothetical protein
MRFASLVVALGLVGRTLWAQPAEDTPTPPAVSPEPPRLVRQEIVYDVDPGAARKRTALWVFLGGSALLLASNQLSWYEKTQWERAVGPSGQPQTSADVDAANHAVKVARYGATPLFVAGAAGIGTAVYLYLTAPNREHVRKTVWMPVVDADHAGVAVTGRF